MSFNSLNEEDDMSFWPPPTPIMENELNKIKEGESYACTECSSNIEIFSIDENDYKISFKCQNINEPHGLKTLPINLFLIQTTKNTYIYSKCSTCNKQQNRINNDEVFKYCTNCKLIFCNKCFYKHNKDHQIINNNETTIKCLTHPHNYNCGYCLDCHIHICYECLESRDHVIHRKNHLKEVKPNDEEINALKNMIQKYKDNKISLEIEKDNVLLKIENSYNKNKLKISKEYENGKNKAEIMLKNELEKNRKYYMEEINNIKVKYEKEMKLKKDIYDICDKKSKEKYKQFLLISSFSLL